MTEPELERPPIWNAFCTALGAEYRDAKEIVGISGLIHPVEAIGVDEVGKRLIVISSETNPRVAALLRGDVQATTPDLRVLVARPMAIDLAHAVRKSFFTELGTLDVPKLLSLGAALQAGDGSDNQDLKELVGEPLVDLFESAKRSKLPIRTHFFNVLEQLHGIQWDMIEELKTGGSLQAAAEVLTQFSALDTLSADRDEGICPIPTYELTDSDWDIFETTKHIDEVRARLEELDIYQYFFPPADRLALGLVDRGGGTAKKLSSGFDLTIQQGHEVSENSLISETDSLPEVIDELKSRGYVVDGEFSMELSEKGRSIRKTLKVRPCEGLISKISKIVSVQLDINLKDLINKK